jgi:adenylate cyclase class 2
MGVEIEAKMRVADLAEMRRRLKAAGGTRAGELEETNTFFDDPQRALQRADKGLRLRANRNVKTGKTEYIVTFKGPRQAATVKTRQELEFSVSDPENAAEVFAALGYKATISFHKRRQSWKLLGCKVELDELPQLGTFIEIEGPSAAKVMACRKKLGLGEEPMIAESYAAMVANQKKKLNHGDAETRRSDRGRPN